VSKTITFEGYSDDTFGYEDVEGGDDYDNCASGKPIEWLVAVPGANEGVIVRGQHGLRCSWCIGVAPYDPDDDDVPIPDWPMSIGPGDRPYSPRLVIEAPDDATVTLFHPERKNA
jgi:hypothetical protein